MKKTQRSKLNMFERMKNLLLGYDPAIIAAIPMLLTWLTTFSNMLITLGLDLVAQDEIIRGFQESRTAAKNILIQSAADLAATMQLYATAIDDVVLLGNMSYTYTRISTCSSVDLKAISQIIANAANAHIAALATYGVTVLTMADYQQIRQAFIDADPKPETAKLAKQAATAALELRLRGLMVVLKKMDRAIRSVRATQTILVENYFRARKIIALATRTYVLACEVKNAAGEAMPLVHVSSRTLGLDRRTTKKGRFIVKTGEEMEHEIIFAFPGYRKVSKMVPICPGIRYNLVVVMEAEGV